MAKFANKPLNRHSLFQKIHLHVGRDIQQRVTRTDENVIGHFRVSIFKKEKICAIGLELTIGLAVFYETRRYMDSVSRVATD